MKVRFKPTQALPVYVGSFGEFTEGEYEVDDEVGKYLIETFPDNFEEVEEEGEEVEDADEDDLRCQAITRSGKRCTRKVVPGEKFCAIHLKYKESEE